MMGATTLQEESMDITTSGNDIYYGEYPDFVLPLPGQPCISDVFVGNSNLHSDAGSPMSILKISCLRRCIILKILQLTEIMEDCIL